MIIRRANVDDLGQIVAFQRAMARETEEIDLDVQTVTRGVTAVFDDSGKGVYYVAEADGAVIGSLLTTFEWSDWRDGTILWIQSVYVLPAFRRKGVYSRLYEHIRAMVVDHPGLQGIRLYADKRNTGARQVYQKLGMTSDHYITFEWLKKSER